MIFQCRKHARVSESGYQWVEEDEEKKFFEIWVCKYCEEEFYVEEPAGAREANSVVMYHVRNSHPEEIEKI